MQITVRKCSYHLFALCQLENGFGAPVGNEHFSLISAGGYKAYPSYPVLVLHRMHTALGAYGNSHLVTVYVYLRCVLFFTLTVKARCYFFDFCIATGNSFAVSVQKRNKISAAVATPRCSHG